MDRAVFAKQSESKWLGSRAILIVCSFVSVLFLASLTRGGDRVALDFGYLQVSDDAFNYVALLWSVFFALLTTSCFYVRRRTYLHDSETSFWTMWRSGFLAAGLIVGEIMVLIALGWVWSTLHHR